MVASTMLNLSRLISPPMLLLPVAIAAGCGSSPSGTAPAKPAPAKPASAPAAKPGLPPAELVGQFTTTLKKSDYPANTPVELDGRPSYLMTVTRDGGVDNAPTLGVTWLKPEDQFVHGTLAVAGSTLTLTDEGCAVAPVELVTSTYGWKLAGDTLRVTTVKNGCTDKVFDAILTSRPWKKR
jgi:hypothetical protein